MKRLFFLLLIFTKTFIYSQRETDNWYFGNKAGINFNNSELNELQDSGIISYGGNSTISDNSGNLLFYTNGVDVWNKNHNLMEGSLPLGLFGDQNNIQNSIIVKKPDSNNYYVFTTMSVNSENRVFGLYYSEIEISSNFPLGKILYSNRRLLNSVRNKISAVHHEDGKSIWLITHGNNDDAISNEQYDTFILFLINERGISQEIKKTSDLIYSPYGSLKFSPNGETIAISDFSEELGEFDVGQSIYIYNFNKLNGDISYNSKINTEIPFFYKNFPLGIDFSQDSEYLFYSSIGFTQTSFIYSYKLNNPSNTLESPKKLIISSDINQFGAVQLANDGNVYVATYINDSEINFPRPEELSPSNKLIKISQSEFSNNFIGEEITLDYGESLRGLPNFVQSYLRTRIINNNNCLNEESHFSIDHYKEIIEVTWEFGDGSTSNSINPTHTYSTPGEFLVKVIITSLDLTTVEIFKKIIIYDLPQLNENLILTQCDYDSDGKALFDLNEIRSLLNNSNYNLTFHTTFTDAQNRVNEIINPDQYENISNNQQIYVSAQNEAGCYNITNIFLNVEESISYSIEDLIGCDGSDNTENNQMAFFDLHQKKESIKDYFNLNNDYLIRFYYSKEDAETTPRNEILNLSHHSGNETIWVRISNSDGCFGIYSFNLIVNPSPRLEIQDEYKICIDNNETSTIYADQDNDRFEWRNSNNNIISINNWLDLTNIGDFSLTVYKTENGIECSNTKNFTVKYHYPPEFTQLQIESDNNSNSIYVEVEGDSSYEFSLDGDIFLGSGNSYTFLNIPSGIYTVYVRDKYKCEPSNEKNISIIGYPNFFTPNNDGKNDIWNIYGLSNQHFNKIDIKIFNRYGKVIHQINETNHTNGWDGYYNGYKLPPNTYWFSASLIDINNNVINKNGNFSLIE